MSDELKEQYEYNRRLQDEGSYSNVQLNEKMVEPDHGISANYASRNFQLGFLDETAHKYAQHKYGLALKYKSVPQSAGGWLTEVFAEILAQELDFEFISSNSINGEGRKSLGRREFVHKDEDNRSKGKGIFGRFRKK